MNEFGLFSLSGCLLGFPSSLFFCFPSDPLCLLGRSFLRPLCSIVLKHSKPLFILPKEFASFCFLCFQRGQLLLFHGNSSRAFLCLTHPLLCLTGCLCCFLGGSLVGSLCGVDLEDSEPLFVLPKELASFGLLFCQRGQFLFFSGNSSGLFLRLAGGFLSGGLRFSGSLLLCFSCNALCLLDCSFRFLGCPLLFAGCLFSLSPCGIHTKRKESLLVFPEEFTSFLFLCHQHRQFLLLLLDSSRSLFRFTNSPFFGLAGGLLLVVFSFLGRCDSCGFGASRLFDEVNPRLIRPSHLGLFGSLILCITGSSLFAFGGSFLKVIKSFVIPLG
ncbi:hypothetical protein Trco_000960 [Trichoderma cornu-damae]|uniref:Uncharacterized protein n=1 Tax=Trichoderma cornu-damae TaxID=654480 RepID=A0A9P8QRC0_9HYPO|nr:hypothetical protein Trco_000960 [Trichoderma cornu-damae]